MFHIYSFEVTIMFPSFLGASIVILESVMDLKTKKFRDILIFKRPTVMAAVPTVYSALVKAKMPKLFIKFMCKIQFLVSGFTCFLLINLYNLKADLKMLNLLFYYIFYCTCSAYLLFMTFSYGAFSCSSPAIVITSSNL